jgi:uncharacterized BrkB/YihY/UPF0761 family membrane protein
MNWKEWREKRPVHVILILLVFTCTGLTVARLGILLTQLAGIERFSLGYWLVWIFGLLPIYNVILLVYAAIFGKYRFFRDKQRRTWRILTGWLRKP